MTLEDRLRQIVTALPDEASVMLPVGVVKGWLDMDGDDPLGDLTVAQVATQLGRTPGTVRGWIRSGDLKAYQLGKEYRITRTALAAFREQHQTEPHASGRSEGRTTMGSGLRAWRKLRRHG